MVQIFSYAPDEPLWLRSIKNVAIFVSADWLSPFFTLADLGQKHVQRLIEGVPAACLCVSARRQAPLGEEQELSRSAHETGQVLGEDRVLVLQKLAALTQDSLKVFAAHRYKWTPVLYAASDNIGFPV